MYIYTHANHKICKSLEEGNGQIYKDKLVSNAKNNLVKLKKVLGQDLVLDTSSTFYTVNHQPGIGNYIFKKK